MPQVLSYNPDLMILCLFFFAVAFLCVRFQQSVSVSQYWYLERTILEIKIKVKSTDTIRCFILEHSFKAIVLKQFDN